MNAVGWEGEPGALRRGEARALALITFEEKQQAENKTMANFGTC